MKTHLNNSKERYHYIVGKSSLPNVKVQALYTGMYSTHSEVLPAPHKHNFYEIMLVTSGTGRIQIQNAELKTQKGDIVIYCPGHAHCEAAEADDNLKSIFFAVKNEVGLRALIDGAGLPSVLPTGHSFRMFLTLFELLISESRKKDIRFSDEICNCICKTVLLEMLHMYSSNAVPHTSNENFVALKTYIDEHYCESFQLQDVCESLYINKFYAAKLFKEYTGVTATRYIIERRMEHASKLLGSTDMSIAQIAKIVGYSDTYHFSRLFKKEIGTSPKSYRTNVRNMEISELTDFDISVD